MILQAVIMAGGKGTRLRPLTHTIPKPMVPVNGRPFLEHLLLQLNAQGFRNILILGGYLADEIVRHFGSGENLELQINYSIEKEPLGTGGALKNAEELLEETFLLLNGDTYLPVDFKTLCGDGVRSGKCLTVSAYKNTEKIVPSNLKLANDHLVVRYDKQDEEGLTHVDAGAMVVQKKVLDLIPKDKSCSLEMEIFPELIRAGQMRAFPIAQRFYDMGTFDQLKVMEGLLS